MGSSKKETELALEMDFQFPAVRRFLTPLHVIMAEMVLIYVVCSFTIIPVSASRAFVCDRFCH